MIISVKFSDSTNIFFNLAISLSVANDSSKLLFYNLNFQISARFA